MGRKKRKNLGGSLEISVEEAASRLGVSSRMINNYINEKRLRAVKVAGQWFIDTVSVDALAQSYGFKPPPLEEKAVTQKEKNSENPPTNNRQKGPMRLAVYRLAQECFLMTGWVRLKSTLPAPWADSLSHKQGKIYEYLGAGYYTWGTEKIGYYRRARCEVGGILGILHSKNEYLEAAKTEAQFLEKRLLPAFTALLIRLHFTPERQRGKSSRNKLPP